MNVLVLFCVIIIVAFFLSFLAKRHFGVPVLGLAVGLILNDLWAKDLTQALASYSSSISGLSFSTIISIVLVIGPAAVLLFSGPVYRKLLFRIGGSLIFAILLAMALVASLGSSLDLSGENRQAFEWLANYREIVLSAGFVTALVDVVLNHSLGRYKKAPSRR